MIVTPEFMNRVGPAAGVPAEFGSERVPRALLVGFGRRGPAFVSALSAEGFRCVAADSLGEAREELGLRNADLVVVAGGESGTTGGRALEILGAEAGGATLLFMADRNDPALARAALDRGADDVVAPPHSAASIALRYHIAGMREPRARRVGAAAKVRLGALEVDLGGRRVLDQGRPVNLSGREYELLTRLLAARGQVVTRETLLDDIWGTDQGSEAVLDATVHRLRRKLEPDLSDPRFLTTVRGVGYRLEPDEVGAMAAD